MQISDIGIPTNVLTVYQENGHKYKGRLLNGMKDDPLAELFFDDFQYVGPFKNDMKHGEGATI
jgi:hypothetical protein